MFFHEAQYTYDEITFITGKGNYFNWGVEEDEFKQLKKNPIDEACTHLINAHPGKWID